MTATNTGLAPESRVFHRVKKESWPLISHAEGLYLYDAAGNRYLDACAGVHVVSIGHGVKEVIEAMHEQAGKVTFAYGKFISKPQIQLAEKIATMTPAGLSRVFFVSGGSEATESAMKMARKYHVETGNPSKYKVITRWQSWHGNTVGALSMSGRSPWRQDYVPYLLDFPHISPCYPYRCAYCKDAGECQLSCAEELERVIKQEGSDSISAFIAEPILGTSACGVMPPPDYFPMVRDICDRHNVIMIVDEVVTGFGRTGLDFGIQHWGRGPRHHVHGQRAQQRLHAYRRHDRSRAHLRRHLRHRTLVRPRPYLWRQPAQLRHRAGGPQLYSGARSREALCRNG